MRLANLAQWTAPTTSLRTVGSYIDADAEPAAKPVAYVDPTSQREPDEANDSSEATPTKDTKTQRYTRGDIVLTSRSLAMEAAALSFMSAGPHDVRPHMLLAMFGEDQRAILACLLHGVRYLNAWCAASRVVYGQDAVNAAAADALSVLYRRRAQVSAFTRAKSLRMREETYRRLRDVALEMFTMRLSEASVAFHTGGIHTFNPADLEIGRLNAPPASNHPRVPPRVVGRQLTLWAG